MAGYAYVDVLVVLGSYGKPMAMRARHDSVSGAETFHGAVAEIVNSAPDTSDELKQKLVELALELDRIKAHIPPKHVATLKRDLENLSHDATKAKRQSELRTHGEGILNGLKVAAEVAAPAAKLIPEILEAVAEL